MVDVASVAFVAFAAVVVEAAAVFVEGTLSRLTVEGSVASYA